MEIIHGRVERFHNDELIVAIPHLGIFISKLTDIGARSKVVEHHELLGLAKLSVPENLADPIKQLRQELESEATGKLARYEEDRGREIAGPAPDLDVLSKGLRLWFAQEYGEWIPVFGKNRSQLAGFPHVGGTPPTGSAVGDPTPHVGGTPPTGLGVGDPTPHVGGTPPTGLRVGDPTPHAGGTPPTGPAAPGSGSGVGVGLLDTRIYPASAMAGRYLARPQDVIDPKDDGLNAAAGHGIFVASSILRQAPAAELDVRSVLDDNSIGDAWDVAKAIVEMADAGVDILNLSFGQSATDDNHPPLLLETAVNVASQRTVIVAAAGNHGAPANLGGIDEIGPTTPVWPAACLGVLAVGALDQDGRRADFSPDVPWVRVLATAVDVTGDYLCGNVVIKHTDDQGRLLDRAHVVQFSGVADWSGTSFAAAAVSGRLAASTIPGVRSAREVLNDLLQSGTDLLCNGIRFRTQGY